VLAEIQIDKKDDEAALRSLERNIDREDLHGDSLDLWLATLKRLGRDRYTQQKLEELVAKYPKKPEFMFGLGVVSHRAGEIPIARPALEKADQMLPNNARILHEWGVLERTAGNIERSQELIGRSLALQPEQPAALRTYGTEHKYRYGDPEFTRLNYAAARISDLEALDQVHMHYALGKAFEDVEELDTAFRHYEIAGVKKRRVERYDERGAVQMFKVMPQLVNAKTIAQDPQPGCQSDVPVFILGMPRSGTSLLEQILSSHPDVFGAGELKFMPGVLDNISVGGRRVGLNDTEPVFRSEENASWEMRGQRYVEKLQKLADKPYKRIVDKMPGNYTLLGLIHAVLPNAHIIHSRRHPVETCLSNYRIHFAEGQHWSYNLRELGRYYKRYWHLMNHWREQFPGAMLEVRYEDNVADVEGQARRVIEYLGLDWDPNCLNFYNTDRPVKTASATQVRKPIYTTSTNRWRKFEKYLGPLLEELGDIPAQYEAMLGK
jgi:tetratricopeptide (TPR) repeat protein